MDKPTKIDIGADVGKWDGKPRPSGIAIEIKKPPTKTNK
jgi:hypothetical protein